MGRKGNAAMRRAGVPVAAAFEGYGDRPTFADVLPLARLITDDFLAGTYTRRGPGPPDASCPRWSSARRSSALLPIEPSARTPRASPATSSSSSPAPRAVLEQLLPRYVATRLYQAVLELTASEWSAKMVAMRSATDNAQELIEDLTLTYNKVRQANITREMIEIATGASAS